MNGLISERAFIGEGVILGSDVSIGPGAVVLGPAVIGDRVWIGPGATIGGPPEVTGMTQNAAWTGELGHQGVRIEDDVVIRENSVVHQGTHRVTTIGRRSWLLARSYVAHDVVIGDSVTVSAGVSIGGHAEIGTQANLGMNAVVHQGRFVGAGAMVGMGTPVSRDVPPFAKVFGTPPRLRGVNSVALRRQGSGEGVAKALDEAYDRGDVLLESSETLSTLDPIASLIAPWIERADRRPVRSFRESAE